MRTVLVTGPGGAGRTTIAAATALAGARRGERVLLLTTESGAPDAVLCSAPPCSPLPSGEPRALAPGLWAARIDSGERFRREFLAFQERAGAALDMLGAVPLDEDELTELPGSQAFALLHALRSAHGTQAWDRVVVDMPPAAETIRLLALPEQARRYLRRLLPPERQAARALRPMLAQLAGAAMPAQKLYEAAERWERELAAVQRVIDDPGTTVRIVTEAGPVAAAGLRTVRAGLSLYGHRAEAVIVNKLLPTDSADPFCAALSGQQQTALKALGAQFPDIPVHEVPHLGRDPQGIEELAELADGLTGGFVGGFTDGFTDGFVGGPADGPAAEPAGATAGSGRQPDALSDAPGTSPDGPYDPDSPYGPYGSPPGDLWTVEDRLASDGLLIWRVPLPGAERESLGLVRRGDELIVSAGPFRRIRTLPSALRRCSVSGAGLRDGALHVRFSPDPALWPRGN
ncbi:ArsA-related P-loop ATPase [Streptomyces sp. MST-110588]|uniref:ArsA family ATPase n=1 Tax=Streptomyces sp. MST-110588 TaxID=2833628 RepID=UPI001F5C6BAA|nr:ArsA-related P-loop ATPase [Streptomyces sp. MST-110588]UNO42544.1 ArsA family ATPase [Streptomyces sp. MST-110588]